MPLPRPLCTRLSAEIEDELAARFEEHDWAPSEGLRNVVHEWLAAGRTPAIEFRDTALGRRAALRGGPEVWEVAAVAGSARELSTGVTAHFSWVAPDALRQALEYASCYPAEIDRILDRNRRLAERRQP
jgi:hypothetical protein